MYTAESLSAQQIFAQSEEELGAGMVPRIFKPLEPQLWLLGHIWGQFRGTMANLLGIDPSQA